jgi:hypothetical protein
MNYLLIIYNIEHQHNNIINNNIIILLDDCRVPIINNLISSDIVELNWKKKG